MFELFTSRGVSFLVAFCNLRCRFPRALCPSRRKARARWGAVMHAYSQPSVASLPRRAPLLSVLTSTAVRRRWPPHSQRLRSRGASHFCVDAVQCTATSPPPPTLLRTERWTAANHALCGKRRRCQDARVQPSSASRPLCNALHSVHYAYERASAPITQRTVNLDSPLGIYNPFCTLGRVPGRVQQCATAVAGAAQPRVLRCTAVASSASSTLLHLRRYCTCTVQCTATTCTSARGLRLFASGRAFTVHYASAPRCSHAAPGGTVL